MLYNVSCVTLSSRCIGGITLQDGNDVSNAEISRREKARLKEMQKVKRQKVQEILDAQNASIEADMVRCRTCSCFCYL